MNIDQILFPNKVFVDRSNIQLVFVQLHINVFHKLCGLVVI